MRITHLGHACLLIEAAGTRILIDPGAFSQAWHGLEDLDGVLITHQHPDHVDPDQVPALLAANPQAVVRTAEDVGQVVELPGAVPTPPGETFRIGSIDVEAVGGDHAVIHADMPRVRNLGYVLSATDEPLLFHPGDSLEATPEGVEVLALPIMGPWAAMKEQVDFVRALGVPARSIPIHDELLSDRGRELLNRQIGRLTGTTIVPMRDGVPREF